MRTFSRRQHKSAATASTVASPLPAYAAFMLAALALALAALAAAPALGASDRAAAGLRAIGDSSVRRPAGNDTPRTDGSLSELTGSASASALSAPPSPVFRNDTAPAPAAQTKVPLFFGYVEFDWDGEGAGAPGFGPAPGAPSTPSR